ncbi:MAG: peptide chain release factor N(5)-glutamine methyltransferase [Tepidanaerobacteraceae bacterium]|nr:peptide chain release factor N(5)-glutamine methyltransferase [Thermoanaerobacterales bacterium]
MTVREALILGRKKLRKVGIPNPSLDAELILSHILAIDRFKLLVDDEIKLTQEQLNNYKDLLQQRCKFIPVAYITGRKEFYGLDFYIKPGVLIPRPETEFVVDEALKAIATNKNPLIADLCCGSGAISVALAFNNKRAKVYASDISDVACEVARINVNLFGLENRVFLLFGDLWSPFKERNIRGFDVVVSNPPYIPEHELNKLPNDVKNEPQVALNGGVDGLDFYRKIVTDVSEFLKPGGTIIFEIGWDQGAKVKALLKDTGFCNVNIVKDYAGFDRVVTGIYCK